MLERWKKYERNVIDVKIMFIMYNFYSRYYYIRSVYQYAKYFTREHSLNNYVELCIKKIYMR